MVRARAVLLGSLIVLALPACDAQQPKSKSVSNAADTPDPTPAPVMTTDEPAAAPAPRHRFAEWQGEWLGPEGMFVIIQPVEPGMYQVQMQSDLETLGTYIGEDDEQGIRFTRNGEQLLLRAATGPETGMKWLEQSKTCLMVRSGEGYCRD